MTRTVLCFGDSNTHGTVPLTDLGQLDRFARNIRWPGVLATALGDDWHVIEEGHPGRTTVHDDPIEGPHRNGLTVLPSLLETHRPVDLVILMLGTNDLKPRFAVTPTDVALSVEKLVTVIRASTSGISGQAPAVLLVAPVPVTETGVLAGIFEGAAGKSQKLAALYKSAATRSGASFIDAAEFGATDPIDGIHLNAETHKAIATAIAAKIRSDFP